MSVETLEELLTDELKDLYSAEKQIIRALPKLIKAVTTPELQESLKTHLEETKGQVGRLERIGEILGKKMSGKTCVGMKGVLEEGSLVHALRGTEDGDSGQCGTAGTVWTTQSLSGEAWRGARRCAG
jgi:ferritin-like metal-binding protein YciE